MSLPQSTQVVIVGAGPTGLILALALHKNGCTDVVVVDSALESDCSSRAVILHAATVEALESVDCADLIVDASIKVSKTTVWTDKGQAPIELASFTLLAKHTKHPYALSVPQHVAEKIIGKVAEERGIRVYRPHRVENIKPNETDAALTDVIFDDGHIMQARCVVGADGARSTIRRLCHVGWADPSGAAQVPAQDAHSFFNMFVADVTLSAPPALFDRDAINLIATEGNVCLLLALPGTPYPNATTDPVYRILCGMPSAFGELPQAPDTAYVQSALDKWGPTVILPDGLPRVEVKQTVWSSRFRTHSSIADTYFTHVPREGDAAPGGPVALIGDAAHIHPPMGGQGMNLGIRDAARLGPVLAEYLRGPATPAVKDSDAEAPLRTWAAGRRKSALTVIALVKDIQKRLEVPYKRMYFLWVIPYNPGWVRNLVLRVLTSFRAFRAQSAWNVSGLGNP